jgi:hypothetical protein
MTSFTSFGKGDPMQATVAPSMWAKLEEQVGIIGSCLPALKSPVEKLLRRFGLLETRLRDVRPSFVKSSGVSLDEVARDADTDSEQLSKGDVRVDSVAVAPGSSGSKGTEQRGWRAV